MSKQRDFSAVQRAWAHRGAVYKSLEHCSSFGPAVAGPSSSGVSPAAPAPCEQHGAVCERAPPASVPDPFEETKMLLAEAMDTESVASDVDYPDSEVDEVERELVMVGTVFRIMILRRKIIYWGMKRPGPPLSVPSASQVWRVGMLRLLLFLLLRPLR